MNDYDFSQLNDKEFEILVIDLLSINFNKRIERFKAGRDKGVDGIYFLTNNKEAIIQCKHYIKSGYKTLISTIKRNEVAKVNKLQPQKYIFATSLPLSRENKTEIKRIFSPHIKIDDDIFGQEDLNTLLTNNPEIEKKHFTLLISRNALISSSRLYSEFSLSCLIILVFCVHANV